MNNIEPDQTPMNHCLQVEYSHHERLVGLFVFSAFILFLFFVIVSVKNQHLFEKKVTFYIDVKNVEGINSGGLVKLLGAEVGTVSGLNIVHGRKIRVSLAIYEKQRSLIRTDAQVVINRLANIGNALIEIKSEALDAPILPDGAVIPVQEPPSLNDVLFGIARIIQSADDKALFSTFGDILPKLKGSIDSIEKILQQVAKGKGTLGAAVFDPQVEGELKVIVSSGAQILNQAESLLRVAEQSLVTIQPALNDANGVVGNVRLVSDHLPELVSTLKQTIQLMNEALLLINHELQDIPGISTEARVTLQRANQILQRLQTLWPIANQTDLQTDQPLITPHIDHD